MAYAIALGLLAVLGAWFAFEKHRHRTHAVRGGIHREIVLPHTQQFELYGNAFSHCSRKARLVLAEVGIPYRHIHIDLIETGSYGTIDPAYLSVNPAGLIPVLVHNGHTIYESDDILAYAVEVAGSGAGSLIPKDQSQHREMAKWLSFCTISSTDPTGDRAHSLGACIPGLTLPLFATMIHYVPVRRILIGLLFHYDRKRPLFFLMAKVIGARRILAQPAISAVIASSADGMRAHLRKVEAALRASNGVWLLGKDFTLADISLGCALLRLEETGWLAQFTAKDDLSATIAYFERVKARPSWRAAILEVRHPLVERGVDDLAALLASHAA